jgi:hypothetical protein
MRAIVCTTFIAWANLLSMNRKHGTGSNKDIGDTIEKPIATRSSKSF